MSLGMRLGMSLARMAAVMAALAAAGCAELRTVTAPPGDLEDYRAYRVAAAEGTRLKRALEYLDKHPNGAWAPEVKAAFDDEEPRFYERAQASRQGVRNYLADLPNGPHADAALQLLVALESSLEEAELRDIARRVRNEDARLERAAVQRRAVGEGILGALGVLVDEDIYGIPRSEAPPKLRALMLGRHAPTWGGVPRTHEEDYFFLLPTRPERESRVMTLETTLIEDNDTIVASKLEGMDMIVRWAEAEQIVRLDSSAPEDRTEAQVFVMGRLEGAFERRFPSASCPDLRRGEELYHRACNGWEAVVTAGTKAGDNDTILIRSPRASVPNRRFGHEK
jgi:hypothetical protein